MRLVAVFVVLALLTSVTVNAQVPRRSSQLESEPIPADVRRSAVQTVTAPVVRARIVNSVLASDQGRAMLQKALGDRDSDPKALCTQTLAGQTVTAGPALRIDPATPDIQHEVGYDAIDWYRGVTISPMGAPRFAEGDEFYSVGVTDIEGVDLSEDLLTLPEVVDQDALPDIDDVMVVAQLPAEPGTYLVTVQLTPYGHQVNDWRDVTVDDGLREKIRISGALMSSASPWTPLADGTAVVLTYSISGDEAFGAYQSVPNVNFVLRIEKDTALNLRLMFGGVTIMRL